MKEQIENLVNDEISKFDVFVDDAFIEPVEGKKVFHIVIDSDEVIDLNKITEVSRVINEIIDQNEEVLQDCDELDIYSKEKGEMVA